MNKSEKFWDRMAKNFDKDTKRFEKAHIRIIENTRKYLGVNDIVLDYGCATGAKTFEIAGHVKKIYGIDLSSKMIEGAKKKADELKIKNTEFTQATINDERLKEKSYDVILAFNILHLLEDSRQVVHRITGLLKPGGLFISITPCLGERMALLTKFQFSFFLLLSKLRVIPQYVKRFKINELENLIGSGNLQIIETEKVYLELTGYFIAAKKNT